MDPYLLFVVILVLFTVAAAGPSLLGREPLAWRCAAEILAWGLALLALAWALRVTSPFVYLLALYLLAMRSRLLQDLANALAARRRQAAFPLYALALGLAGNPLDRVSARINLGAALLHNGQVERAITTLEEVLAGAALGPKLGAACSCNLGLAYLRAGDTERGCAHLRDTVSTMPASIYAQRARHALQGLDAPASQP